MSDNGATHPATEMQAQARPARTIRIRIKRCDGPGKPSRWEAFDVPIHHGGSANVISCLQWIAAHPITVEGTATTPPVWDSGCLEEVCGACTMRVNGRVRQACSALIEHYAPNEGDEIALEPMSKFPVVRDLFVDRQRLFTTLKRIRGWVPIDGTYHLGSGPKERPSDQRQRYKLAECMSCGCCLEACPQYTLEPDQDRWDTAFVGAAVIGQVRYFNMHETGGTLAKKRLAEMARPGGVSDCGNAQNCVRVCPKEIPLTEAIASVGRATTIDRIRRFFAGGDGD